jgi:hypothetical protein
MAQSDGLRALQVGVSGHQPSGVRGRFRGEGVDEPGEQRDGLFRRVAAVQPKVEGDLIVARPACVQDSAGGRDFRQPALDRGVDVFVGSGELELALVKLALDA